MKSSVKGKGAGIRGQDRRHQTSPALPSSGQNTRPRSQTTARRGGFASARRSNGEGVIQFDKRGPPKVQVSIKERGRRPEAGTGSSSPPPAPYGSSDSVRGHWRHPGQPRSSRAHRQGKLPLLVFSIGARSTRDFFSPLLCGEGGCLSARERRVGCVSADGETPHPALARLAPNSHGKERRRRLVFFHFAPPPPSPHVM